MNKLSIFALVAAMSAGINNIPMPRMSRRVPGVPKNYPRMVTSSPEEITKHNSNVQTRQVLRRASRPWKIAAKWDAT